MALMIPKYRVMNWTERGVRGTDDDGRMCGARMLDANMDDRDITPESWARAVRMCQREPCICRDD